MIASVAIVVSLMFEVMPRDPFAEDDMLAFQDEVLVKPPAPMTAPTILTPQSRIVSIPTTASAHARGSPVDDTIEQHVLHAMFADGVASEVPAIG